MTGYYNWGFLDSKGLVHSDYLISFCGKMTSISFTIFRGIYKK